MKKLLLYTMLLLTPKTYCADLSSYQNACFQDVDLESEKIISKKECPVKTACKGWTMRGALRAVCLTLIGSLVLSEALGATLFECQPPGLSLDNQFWQVSVHGQSGKNWTPLFCPSPILNDIPLNRIQGRAGKQRRVCVDTIKVNYLTFRENCTQDWEKSLQRLEHQLDCLGQD